MTRSDFIGSEFEWYAVDQDGFLAIFFSAGWGPVPDVVFDSFAAQKLIETWIGLSQISYPDANFQATSRRLFELGVFAYDWLDSFGPYRRFVNPEKPVALTDLHFSHQSIAFIHLPNVRFKDRIELIGSDIPSFTDVEDRLGTSS
jgi:hypothetical protein